MGHYQRRLVLPFRDIHRLDLKKGRALPKCGHNRAHIPNDRITALYDSVVFVTRLNNHNIEDSHG